MIFQNPLSKVFLLIESQNIDYLTLKNLTKEAFISRAHLQRIFKSTTGMTIIEYARKRCLAKTIYELLNTNFRIIDIANKYGFKYEQSYIRMFFKEYGCTPGEARKRKKIIQVQEYINPITFSQIDKDSGIKLAFSPNMFLVGESQMSNNFDSKKDFIKFKKKIKNFFDDNNIQNRIEPFAYVILINLLKDDRFEWFLGVQVKNLKNVPKNLKGIIVPSYFGINFNYKQENFFDIKNLDIENFFTNQNRYIKTNMMYFEVIYTKPSYDEYCIINSFIPIRDTLDETIC